MNIERLRKIINFNSEDKKREIKSLIKKFCSFTGIDSDNDVLNIMQIVRPAFDKKGFLVLEIPFADNEIGALCYKGDGLGYVVINSSLPKVNVNFAVAHEIYHVFFQESEFISKVEFSDDYYYENEEEYSANLFAGMLLMPEVSFRQMFGKFKDESKGDLFDTIIKLVSYYQVPYMAVLVRCYELNLPDNNTVSNELLDASKDIVKQKFNELWLDDSILNSSKKDDYIHVESMVKRFGEEYITDSFINERTLKKVIQNMQVLYNEIKGE